MAFGSLGGGDEAPMSEINVTPLVDVMLVLLIVFMITMPVLTHSIPLQLPVAASKDDVQAKEPLRLAISKDGEYVLGLGETRTDLAQLQAELKKAVAADADVVLAISADKTVAYDHVAQALAAARDAGLSKVGFVTEEAQP